MRPSKLKLNKETKKRLIEAVSIGAPYKDAAEYAGITERTFYKWRRQAETTKNDKDECLLLIQELKKAESKGKIKLLNLLQRKSNRNWVVAAWILERRYPEEFGRRLVDYKNTADKNIVIDLPEELQDIDSDKRK